MASKEELKKLLEKPVSLAPNTYLKLLQRGKLRAKFMGEPDPRTISGPRNGFSRPTGHHPGRDNPPDKGISRVQLPGGGTMLLTELLEASRMRPWAANSSKVRAKLGVLLKIFDVGDNAHIRALASLPEILVRAPQFALRQNQAWIVIDTRPGAKAWVGFKRDITKQEFKQWMEAQDVETMRKHMH